MYQLDCGWTKSLVKVILSTITEYHLPKIVPLIGLLYAPQTQAQELSYKGFDFHGSLAQTFAVSDGDNEYLISKSDEGTFQFTEALLNVSKQFTDDFRFGVQGIVRDFGDEDNFKPALDWGYADYRLSNYLGIRAGRVKAPIGFLGEARDVDSSHSSILLNQGLYPEWARTISNSYDGAGIYGSFGNFEMGFLDYHIFYGTKREMPDTFRMQRSLQQLDPSAEIELQEQIGISLIYETPLEGLRLGLTQFQADTFSDLTVINEFTGSRTIYPDEFDYRTKMHTFSGEYNWNKWTFTAEYTQSLPDVDFSQSYTNAFAQSKIPPAQQVYDGTYQAVYQEVYDATYDTVYQAMGGDFNPAAAGEADRIAQETGGAKATEEATKARVAIDMAVQGLQETVSDLASVDISRDSRGWNFGTEYQWNDQLSLILRYGEEALKEKTTDPNFHRKDLSLGARYDFNQYLIGKVEYHRIRGKLGQISGDSYDTNFFLTRLSFSF
ncbi:MAG: hypothetical protein HQL32_06290 [Planctomycetes bacterium]|nr:hypothetical protein [Planctomycetota bacterium]